MKKTAFLSLIILLMAGAQANAELKASAFNIVSSKASPAFSLFGEMPDKYKLTSLDGKHYKYLKSEEPGEADWEWNETDECYYRYKPIKAKPIQEAPPEIQFGTPLMMPAPAAPTPQWWAPQVPQQSSGAGAACST